ncbi:hypothetical protein DE146DRAFT_40804 [Phaeosphaeria sp. MPI-PUGE-AT-0046c]|nr:hypothetical protein DE146DRAFT_40804 [Phaeosphaeria sp. MPI-PUGE-AT-0046c]
MGWMSSCGVLCQGWPVMRDFGGTSSRVEDGRYAVTETCAERITIIARKGLFAVCVRKVCEEEGRNRIKPSWVNRRGHNLPIAIVWRGWADTCSRFGFASRATTPSQPARNDDRAIGRPRLGNVLTTPLLSHSKDHPICYQTLALNRARSGLSHLSLETMLRGHDVVSRKLCSVEPQCLGRDMASTSRRQVAVSNAMLWLAPFSDHLQRHRSRRRPFWHLPSFVLPHHFTIE